jgi:hypothetical protein
MDCSSLWILYIQYHFKFLLAEKEVLLTGLIVDSAETDVGGVCYSMHTVQTAPLLLKKVSRVDNIFLEKMDSLMKTANTGLTMDKKRSLEEDGDNPQHLSNKHARKDAGHLKIQEHASSLLPGSQDAGESTVMSAPVLQAFKEIAREFSLEHNYKIWVNYCVKNDLKTAAVLTDFLTYPEFRQDVEASPFTFGTRIKLKQLLASNKVNATPIQVASNSLIPRKYWKLLFMMFLSYGLFLIGCPWQWDSRRIFFWIIKIFLNISKRDSKK